MNTYTLITYDKANKRTRQINVPYSIIDGVEHVTEHFSRAELDTGHEENVMLFQPSLQIIEKIRLEVGAPVTGNSGYRSRKKQQTIWDETCAKIKRKYPNWNQAQIEVEVNKTVAHPGNSPHENGSAVDLKIPKGFTPDTFAKLIQKVSVDLGFPMCRVGWKKYLGQGFVHMDTAYLLFHPYTEVTNPQPRAWVPGLVW